MPQYTKKVLTVASGNDSVVTATGWVPLNQFSQPFNVSFGVNASVAQFRVQHTFDDIQDASVTPFAFTNVDVTAAQAAKDGNYAFPVAAIRLQLVSAAASGRVSANFWVRQAGL